MKGCTVDQKEYWQPAGEQIRSREFLTNKGSYDRVILQLPDRE